MELYKVQSWIVREIATNVRYDLYTSYESMKGSEHTSTETYRDRRDTYFSTTTNWKLIPLPPKYIDCQDQRYGK